MWRSRPRGGSRGAARQHALLGLCCWAGQALGGGGGARCDFERLDGSRLGEDEFRRRFRSGPPGRPAVLGGLDLGPGLERGRGGSGWGPEVLSARFGQLAVESRDAVVYAANGTGGLARSGLGEATTLGAILGAPGATLFLLKPHHPAVAALGRGLAVPAALRPLQLTGPTLSLGGRNSSSPFHEHPENWFAQVSGKKAWIVRPSGASAKGKDDLKSAHPCKLLWERRRPKGVLQCVLKEGEVLYLPPQWAHGTCNVADFSLGIGFIGQLDHLPELHLAVALGDETRTQDLLRMDADLSSTDREGKRPLHWAAHRGHVQLAKELLRHRADIRAEDAHGATPVHLGAFEGHLAVVKALVRVSKSIATARTHAGAQPLHLAASRGHAAIASFLLKQGAAAAARDSKGAEPLHMAAYEGHLAVADLLLARGASPSSQADDGTEPAHLARKRGHRLVVERLAGGRSSGAPSRGEL